jgi:Txe/YoeB family toxin of Txe-Axe toxin-antitoxin module
MLIDTIRQSDIESLHEPEDLIGHILYHCATFLDQYRDAGVGDHILDIFDSTIAQRVRRPTCQALSPLLPQSATSKPTQTVDQRLHQSDDEVARFKQFSSEVEQREKGRGKIDLSLSRSINNEIKLIYEVKDIRDELNLLRHVFETQTEVLDKFARLFWPRADDDAKQSRDSYCEACNIKPLIERTNRLDSDAVRTLEGVSAYA